MSRVIVIFFSSSSSSSFVHMRDAVNGRAALLT